MLLFIQTFLLAIQLSSLREEIELFLYKKNFQTSKTKQTHKQICFQPPKLLMFVSDAFL